MFDWFWNFLYGISKSIFHLIDSLLTCANILCGIEPIQVGDDKDVNLMNFLLSNNRVALGFKTAAIFGIILVAIFSVFAIIRSIVSEKANTTPMRVFGTAFKTILMFIFIPVCMVVLIHFTNIFMEGLYKATLGGSSNGMGNFLCGAFSSNALRPGMDPEFYVSEGFDYMNTSCVRQYIYLDDFDFFFSWIAGVCILIELAKALMMFVDRAISIVVLFIISPISMSTSVIDDGAHFKLWRDQFIVKFLSAYGCILALNVYALIISIISNDQVIFTDSSFLNNVMKIAFILGGAISMQRVMALIGNIISSGAGTNEMRENAMANARMAGVGMGIGRALTSPFRAARGAYNFARDAKQYGVGSAIGSRLGFKTDKDYGIKNAQQQQNEANSKKQEHQQLANMIGERVADAIAGKGGNNQNSGSNSFGQQNNNNNQSNNNKNNALQNALVMSVNDNSNKDNKKK